LQEEWLLQVQGLAYPSSADGLTPAAAQAFSAIALFVQQARRVVAGFTLLPADVPAVVRLCQLVEGVPLGLELAASWLRVLTCAEIVTEIEHGLDFLTTGLQNVPERHRSLRAVFDHSWALLSAPEQAAFRQLAVFRGGFRREAATEIVGVSLPMLAGLVDKSLLRRTADGRYEVHDLLRQYAAERLQADPQQSDALHNRHCRYYARVMAAHSDQLKSDQLGEALAVLSAERDNVRAAWDWAVSHRRVDELNLFMDCL
jgi:predicted ATPase